MTKSGRALTALVPNPDRMMAYPRGISAERGFDVVVRNPVADAEEVLDRYWADSGGDLRFPIDPVRIARLLGAEVYVDNLAPGVSGQIEAGDEPTIFLSIDNGPNRQRFTCAHEIGHLVSRKKYGGTGNFVDYRDGRAGAGTDPEEIYANQFAAELLMPRRTVQADAERNRSTESMARKYGVSVAAMAIRRDNLRCS